MVWHGSMSYGHWPDQLQHLPSKHIPITGRVSPMDGRRHYARRHTIDTGRRGCSGLLCLGRNQSGDAMTGEEAMAFAGVVIVSMIAVSFIFFRGDQ